MQTIRRTKDVSSRSPELEIAWTNWAQEAHLSSRRANLVAALDWSGHDRVLEVGCGCGAITRYLGEQGLAVDALEVSMRRATIARERCRDLDNVDFFCANLNDIELPEHAYSCVLLIGVLEYAARFSTDKKPAKQIVRDILTRCMSTVTERGAILVAIENRLGFKYIAGASEDHYGVPRIGLYDYPAYDSAWSRRKTGIHTLDYGQWRRLLDTMKDTHYHFFFPFPDYKLPEVILDEDYIRTDSCCFQILNRLRSRDYCANWTSPIDEYLYWQVATQCGQLDKTANSFAIILGKDQERIGRFMPHDFIRFANLKRKSEYRITTYLPKGEQRVVKHRISDQAPDDSSNVVRHKLRDSQYVHGRLLSDIWIEACSSLAEVEILTGLLEHYYGYLVARSHNGLLDNSEMDLLVFNLIVDEDQQWHTIDVEWEWKRPGEISVDFILFRSLLYFGYVHGDVIANCFTDGSLVSVDDFVVYGFQHLGLDYTQNREVFHAMENEFQSSVLHDRAYQSVDTIQRQPLIWNRRLGLPWSAVDVFWSVGRQGFSAENSMSLDYKVLPGSLHLKIDLPVLKSDIQGLRIDPVDHRLSAGYRTLEIRRIKLSGERREKVWGTKKQILDQAVITGLCPDKGDNQQWLVTSIDPQIILRQTALSDLGRIKSVELELRWPGKCFVEPPERHLEAENERLMELLGSQAQ